MQQALRQPISKNEGVILSILLRDVTRALSYWCAHLASVKTRREASRSRWKARAAAGLE